MVENNAQSPSIPNRVKIALLWVSFVAAFMLVASLYQFWITQTWQSGIVASIFGLLCPALLLYGIRVAVFQRDAEASTLIIYGWMALTVTLPVLAVISAWRRDYLVVLAFFAFAVISMYNTLAFWGWRQLLRSSIRETE